MFATTMLKNLKITRAVAQTAAGATDVNGSTIDTAGYTGVMFILDVGTLTATQVTSMRAQQGAASDASDMADLEGSIAGPVADTDGQRYLVIDLFRPLKRYVRVVVDRATANAVLNGGVAILYGARDMPVTNAAAAGGIAFSKTLVTPAEGTP